MKRFFVYVLRCSDDSLYVGVTSTLEQRIAQHHEGTFPGCYTFRRRPLSVVHVSEFAAFDEAFAAEKKLKRWSRAKKEAFVRGDFGELHWLARRRTAALTPSP